MDWCFSLKPKNSQMILPLKPSMDGTRNGSDTTLVSMQTKTIPGTMIACRWDNRAFQAPIKPNTGIQWERTGISENLQSEKAELHHRSCCCCQSGLKALAQMHQMSPLRATNFIKVHNIQKLLLLCCITSASLITWLQARGVILISYHYFILF